MEKKIQEMVLSNLPTGVYLKIRHWYYKRNKPEAYRNLQNHRQIEVTDGYSYRPFDTTRSIFVHIPKCAGISVNRCLYGNLAGGHSTLEEYLDAFTPEEIISYFKFTVVRNPWDRLVSAYHFLKKGGCGYNDKTWFADELSEYADFEDFVKKWVNRDNIWKWHHFRPQYHYMLDKRGKVQLDFIAFLENIEADFSLIAERLGKDVSLPKSNQSERKDHAAYYTEETRNIVADAYAEDIKMLGYEFDNSSLKKQLKDRDAGKKYVVQRDI